MEPFVVKQSRAEQSRGGGGWRLVGRWRRGRCVAQVGGGQQWHFLLKDAERRCFVAVSHECASPSPLVPFNSCYYATLCHRPPHRLVVPGDVLFIFKKVMCNYRTCIGVFTCRFVLRFCWRLLLRAVSGAAPAATRPLRHKAS